MFDFLKKKQEDEGKTEVKQEVQTPEPQKSEKMLTELPEFPIMEEEDVSVLPKLEPLSELEKSEINIPSLGETTFGKPAIYPEKNITPKFDELKKGVEEQETEEEIKLPPEIMEEFEEPISKEDVELQDSLKEEKRFTPEKIKTEDKRIFSLKKPVFVNIKSYQGISNEINVVINILENSEEVVKGLNNIKIRENNELKKMHDSLEGLNKKIITVDDILSKG